MKLKFTFSGALLAFAGVLHLVMLILSPFDTTAVLTTAFHLVIGVIYIVLGVLLLRLNDHFLLNSALVVLFGLLVDLSLYPMMEGGYSLVLLLLEALTLAVLGYLHIQGRTTLHRVR